MTTNGLKTGAHRTAVKSSVPNITQALSNVESVSPFIYRTVSQTFEESRKSVRGKNMHRTAQLKQNHTHIIASNEIRSIEKYIKPHSRQTATSASICVLHVMNLRDCMPFSSDDQGSSNRQQLSPLTHFGFATRNTLPNGPFYCSDPRYKTKAQLSNRASR
jgi:hypothetical protein